MNVTIYIALSIIILLIIFYFCFKAYLINTQTTTIEVNDHNQIKNECLYNEKTKILFCHYLADGKKFVMTDTLKNKITNWSNEQPFVFNSDDFNLPNNGVLKIRFICNKNKKNQN